MSSSPTSSMIDTITTTNNNNNALFITRKYNIAVTDLIAANPPTKDNHIIQPIYHNNDKNNNNVLHKTVGIMTYVAPEIQKITLKRDPNGNDQDSGTADWDEVPVYIENGRISDDMDKLDISGFELIPNDIISETIDFLNKDDVIDSYYPHCEQLLRKYYGNNVMVRAFDHNVRKQQEGNGNVQKPISMVHGDYTTNSAPRRLDLLGQPPKINDIWRSRLDENTPLLDPNIVQECITTGKRRYAFINVWRNIDKVNTVQTFPLACVDARTVNNDKDLRILELHYTDRIGENYLVCYNNNNNSNNNYYHRWVYYPEMSYNEALLIKQWDTKNDKNIAKFSIHSAFVDAISPINAPPRQSIEVRCVLIWDN